ncbi:MAG: FAD:protein FMN transferase [Balneolales bacterium]
MIKAVILILLITVSSLFSPDPDLQRYEFEAPHMGTRFRIIMYAPDEEIAKSASNAAFGQIEALNDIMSDYDSDSELNRLSRSSGSEAWISLSPHLYGVLKKAEEVSRKSDGAFDITIGAYVQLWRDLRRKDDPRLPAKDVIADLKERTGYQHIIFNDEQQSVKLLKSGMQLDLGGIAKGYAADEALKAIQNFGIMSALVDAGGDISMGEAPPNKEGWDIAIPSKDEMGKTSYIHFSLANQAIATSGDLFQFTEINGIRYSHIINPHTGMGLIQSHMVTIIAQDGITADSYASALSVLGPSAIQKFQDESGLAIHIETLEDGNIIKTSSPSFEALIE